MAPVMAATSGPPLAIHEQRSQGQSQANKDVAAATVHHEVSSTAPASGGAVYECCSLFLMGS